MRDPCAREEQARRTENILIGRVGADVHDEGDDELAARSARGFGGLEGERRGLRPQPAGARGGRVEGRAER